MSQPPRYVWAALRRVPIITGHLATDPDASAAFTWALLGYDRPPASAEDLPACGHVERGCPDAGTRLPDLLAAAASTVPGPRFWAVVAPAPAPGGMLTLRCAMADPRAGRVIECAAERPLPLDDLLTPGAVPYFDVTVTPFVQPSA